jgi:hypothetical protein
MVERDIWMERGNIVEFFTRGQVCV